MARRGAPSRARSAPRADRAGLRPVPGARPGGLTLIVSHPEDAHVPRVAAALERLGRRSVLLDLASLPRFAALTVTHRGDEALGAWLRAPDGTTLRAEEVASIWWRRPLPYVTHPELAPDHASFAFDQLHEAVAGLWSAMPARWVNQPWADQRAGHKVGQLLVAERLGLAIPQTLVSTSPLDAREFLEQRPGMAFVKKQLKGTARFGQPTRPLSLADLDRLDALRFGPAIIQEYVPGVDLRVTVAGDDLFATEIDPRRTSSPHDFRPVFDECRVEEAHLPVAVEEALRALVDHLGLVYAAIDLRRDEDGRHVLLEVNPAGQWLFLEERTGQPISLAVARALVSG